MLKLIISDFDGTLVDTFEANFLAYKEAFQRLNLDLSREKYRECFGFRFDKFMEAAGVSDIEVIGMIKKHKADLYPTHFDLLKPNSALIELIRHFRQTGGKTALASTAARPNLLNALRHIGAIEDFDLILSGESVKHGKPDPEIYQKVLDYFNVEPGDAIVFEDSEIGRLAAIGAGIPVVVLRGF